MRIVFEELFVYISPMADNYHKMKNTRDRIRYGYYARLSFENGEGDVLVSCISLTDVNTNTT